MCKEETIIQTWNNIEQRYEYSIKGFDVTESVKKLLLRHKEEYDKQKFNIGNIQGYLEAKEYFDKQLAELKAENELNNKNYLYIKELNNINYIKRCNAEDSNKEKQKHIEWADNYIKKLEQQLKERDEEIEDLKAKLKSTELCFNITNAPTKEEMVKRITKQVCEKIKEIAEKRRRYDSTCGNYLKLYDLGEILDQIEKGGDNSS